MAIGVGNLSLVVLGAILSICAISTLGCNSQGGWGKDAIVIPIPRPTLIPKLKAAFHDGKASVQWKTFGNKGYGKGISLKHHIHQNSLGWGEYEYGYGVNNPQTHDVKEVYEKGHGATAKGHYHVDEPHSYKAVNYDTTGHELEHAVGIPPDFPHNHKK